MLQRRVWGVGAGLWNTNTQGIQGLGVHCAIDRQCIVHLKRHQRATRPFAHHSVNYAEVVLAHHQRRLHTHDQIVFLRFARSSSGRAWVVGRA